MKLSAATSHLVPRHCTDEEAIRLMARVGFEAIDYGFTNHHRHTGVYTTDSYQEYARHLRRVADQCGVTIGQTHANYPSYTGNPEEDKYLLGLYEREIIATSILGGRYMIVHPAVPDGCVYDKLRDEAKDINIERLQALQKCAEEYDVVICLENTFVTDRQTKRKCPTACSEAVEIVDYLETLNSDRFAACLDVGHANALGLSIPDEIHTLGKHLRAVHIHDNDGRDDLHAVPFLHPKLSSIDWGQVCTALRETGYSGTFNFESDAFMASYPRELVEDAMSFLEKTGRYLIRQYHL